MPNGSPLRHRRNVFHSDAADEPASRPNSEGSPMTDLAERLDALPVALQVLLFGRDRGIDGPVAVRQPHVARDRARHERAEPEEEQRLGRQLGGEHAAEVDRAVPQEVGPEVREQPERHQHDTDHDERGQQHRPRRRVPGRRIG